MAKGKFSQPRNQKGGEPRTPHLPRRQAEEETQILPPQSELEALARQPDADFASQASVSEESPRMTIPEEAVHAPMDEEAAIDQAFLEMTEPDDEESENSDPAFLKSVSAFVAQNRKYVLVGACAVVLVIILGIIAIVGITAATDPYDGKILNNVLIAGVNVGGMTKSEAEEAVSKVTANTFTQMDMVVELPDDTLRLSPADTGAKLDVKAVVKAAYSYGRTGTKAEQQTAYNKSLTGNHTIGLLPYLNLDEAYIRDALEEYASQFDTDFVQSSYTLEGEMPALDAENFDETTPCQTLMLSVGTPGLGLDIETLYNDILDAYSFNTFQVTARASDTDGTPDPLDLEAIYAEVCVEPVNATVDMETFEVIPGSYGYVFDLEKAQKLLSKAAYGDTVGIPMEYAEPDILEDEVFFQDVLGSCETPHNTNENRNTNLRILCETLNGHVIYPGETFSYNETLGERTAEKGYKPAPAYSGLETVNVTGGGVCQGSSTLYYCCLLADLEIVDRVNHGFVASYIDYGMDATVNWGTTDFKFKNNFNFPIMIEAEYTDTHVKMKLLGTDEKDYYVEMEYRITAEYEPETLYETHSPDSGYYNGQVLKDGKTGYFVKTYKLKYSKETNELISRDFEANSRYTTVNRVVVVIEDNSTQETTPPDTTQTTTPPETTQATAPPETTQATAPPETTQATEASPPPESGGET